MQLISYPVFKDCPQIIAWTSTREGGFSKGNYKGLNCSFTVGDDPIAVEKNRNLLLPMLKGASLVEIDQIHGKHILEVNQLPPTDRLGVRLLGQADAMFTQRSMTALAIKHADCQAALIYDPRCDRLGAAHAGWKGLVAGIYPALIARMCERGSKPQDLKVAISASLGPCCSEFINWKVELKPWASAYRTDDASSYFNLQAIARDQLRAAGVLEDNLCIDTHCTRCEYQRFFSFRKQKQTGRMLSVISLIK